MLTHTCRAKVMYQAEMYLAEWILASSS